MAERAQALARTATGAKVNLKDGDSVIFDHETG
jgi:hypothetical protein